MVKLAKVERFIFSLQTNLYVCNVAMKSLNKAIWLKTYFIQHLGVFNYLVNVILGFDMFLWNYL